MSYRKTLENISFDLIKKHGVFGFNFSDIAKLSGCSMNTLYKHFKNKNDLICQLYNKTTTIPYVKQYISKIESGEIKVSSSIRPIVPSLIYLYVINKTEIFHMTNIILNPYVYKFCSSSQQQMIGKLLEEYYNLVKNQLQYGVDKGIFKKPENFNLVLFGLLLYTRGYSIEHNSTLSFCKDLKTILSAFLALYVQLEPIDEVSLDELYEFYNKIHISDIIS